MNTTWQFKDEWLVRALAGVKGTDEVIIAQMRVAKEPYLSHALVDAGVLTAEQLGKAVELTYNVKYKPLTPESADMFGLKLVQEKICRKHNVIPVGMSEEKVILAMADPLNMDAQSDVEAVTGRAVTPYFALPLAVEACIEHAFRSDEVIYDLLTNVISPEDVTVVGEDEVKTIEGLAITSPIIALANSIISQAYRKRSSDIHIEHEEKSSHVRIRIDGILKTIMSIPRYIATGPLVSRIKIMADLDVSVHMRPQDGRTKLRIGTDEVGLRVSTLPTAYGEKVVMRILDPREAEVPFEKLGFAPEVSRVMEACLEASQGMILVTGPTGSGKTTTLYSALNKIRSGKTNIVTVEDPIEYRMSGINQVQVNDKQGLSFATVLRSVLRQDPDKSQELAFNLGVDDYIIKPFKGPLVVARIKAALHRVGKFDPKCAPGQAPR